MPFQEAKWALDGNRVMSPTSTSNRAAPVGTNAVEVQQARAGLLHQFGELLVRGLLGVDPLQISDQLGGDAAPGLADYVTWPDLGQQCLGWAATDPASRRLG